MVQVHFTLHLEGMSDYKEFEWMKNIHSTKSFVTSLKVSKFLSKYVDASIGKGNQ